MRINKKRMAGNRGSEASKKGRTEEIENEREHNRVEEGKMKLKMKQRRGKGKK